MRDMRSSIIMICLLGLMFQQAASRDPLPFATFGNTLPAHSYNTNTFASGDKVKFVLTWVGTAVYTPTIIYVPPTGASTAYPPGSGQATTTANSYVFQKTPTVGGKYTVNVTFTTAATTVTEYNIQFFVNGTLTFSKSDYAFADTLIPIFKFTILQACELSIKVNGLAEQNIGVFKNTTAIWATAPDYQSASKTSDTLIINFPEAGTYYIFVLPGDKVFPLSTGFTLSASPTLLPFIVTLETFCDSYCPSPNFPTAPVCRTCGNAILEDGEECDNGNKAGCIGCFVAQGYTCIGNPGGSSLCSKPAVCGDGVLDSGEQCDNGRRTGCSTGCTLDSGYKCTGSPSVCSFCGNGIVETGEECDNKNSVGCSVGCKVDIGFECRGTSSYCTRKDPVCGNNVIEIAESCDDGNNLNGDGCSQYCFVEKDFTCSGQFGESSKCQKSTTPTPTIVCGNGIVETGEECDNYGQLGCTACKIESGWDCLNVQGFPSACTPRVIVKSCGDGVYEPNKGQSCDDGNVVSGDGCSSFCLAEPGWICIDNRFCVRVEDPRVKLFCGNGAVETIYGQVCDDGNNVDGDGCNRNCKVENGWSCRILTLAENKSYCSSSAGLVYCGNGIVDSGETCDDGFPLLNNDGCNVNCQQEPGWNCQSGRCFRI